MVYMKIEWSILFIFISKLDGSFKRISFKVF